MKNIVVNILGISLISSLIIPSALAQFVYPSSSFFYPPANLSRGINPTSIQWLESNDAKVFGFLLSTSNFKSELITEESPVTILAPTDEAFAELPTEIREKLSDPLQMQKFLQHHLISNIVSESDIKKGEITTLEGNSLKIQGRMMSDRTTEIRLNDAVALESARLNNNTVVILLDQVLLPPDLNN
ncbi:MAG: fasciclin domain-containing protein [Pleurocapsa sp.]